MKILVIIPTYNESTNIIALITGIEKLNLNLDILIIDDNSPDNTADLIKERQKKQNNLHLLFRPNKQGLGSAYLAGFAWAKINGYEAVVQMDADFSHSPSYLPALLTALNNYSLVIGSRYITGGGINNWSLLRKLISYNGNLYASFILGSPIKDLTSGFNAWQMTALDKIDQTNIQSNGYSFQIEIKNQALKNHCSWQELPIVFEERRRGQSKLKGKIFWEAIWRVWQIKFKK